MNLMKIRLKWMSLENQESQINGYSNLTNIETIVQADNQEISKNVKDNIDEIIPG